MLTSDSCVLLVVLLICAQVNVAWMLCSSHFRLWDHSSLKMFYTLLYTLSGISSIEYFHNCNFSLWYEILARAINHNFLSHFLIVNI